MPTPPAPPTPRITVGLPVFNGEAYLQRALDSVLGQTLGDLELLICDNASTDGTEALSRAAAAADPRVRYVRHPENLGAAPNFNRALELARGPLFRWMAHDDELEPTCLEACVQRLDADPGLVLCHSQVRIIDAQGETLELHDTGLERAGDGDVATRFAALVLNPHLCTEIFAVMRTEVLRRTPLHGSYHGNDRALLAAMALLGRFAHVPEPLFRNREHAERYVRRVRPEDRSRWAKAGAARKVGSPTLDLYRSYRSSVEQFVPGAGDRAGCRAVLRRFWLRNWHAARLGVELASAVYPPLHRQAGALRRCLSRT